MRYRENHIKKMLSIYCSSFSLAAKSSHRIITVDIRYKHVISEKRARIYTSQVGKLPENEWSRYQSRFYTVTYRIYCAIMIMFTIRAFLILSQLHYMNENTMLHRDDIMDTMI